ncbi:tRNA (N(6)-L-threonylcarbamoyladenosine(37)-C(2))-methylthiotransferase [Candidatus Nitrososphaera evergladensis]|nr:tRNA (N(6)-L-threonylcarbamoyladenosine(37)-C(2))-methylthiotransferase [Candidatus Nitrososphaera evergladensis]
MYVRSLKPKLIESIHLIKRQEKEEEEPAKGKEKVWIEAYGCSASMADSEMITGLLKNAGYEIASSRKEGSLNLIVTCSVKDTTEHKMVHRIKQLSKTGKPLVIAGCLPKADRAMVESLSPMASLMGPHSIDRSADVVGSAFSGNRLLALEDSRVAKVNIPRVRINPVVSIVEIASGCMSECTFCQTKLAKGWLYSYRIGDIARQVRDDVSAGCKEVWLTSTDSGCYGRDMGTNLAELLRACAGIDGDFKIRVGMLNPQYMPDMIGEIADVYARNDRLFRFIHMPVQSGSERILRKMKRGHTAQVFSEAVKTLRAKMPDFTISTDIIVGFPNETEEDFQRTLDLLNETQPDVVNISRYSARPGTESARMKNRVSSQVAKERSARLTKLVRDIAKKRNASWKGWQGEIVIDELGKVAQGRNYAYKSVVLADKPDNFKLGEKIRVEVYDFSSFSLKARAIL